MTTSALPCPGCQRAAINVGTFARTKFVCPTYNERSKATTSDCIGGLARPSFHDLADAVAEWNRSCGERGAA